MLPVVLCGSENLVSCSERRTDIKCVLE